MMSRLRQWIQRGDLTAIGVYIAAAVYITGLLWVDPFNRIHATNEADQAFFHWVLAHAAQSLAHGENPMFDSTMNVPLGVNLMANTSILAFAIPLAPVTLWLGPAVSYLIVLTIGFSATAYAWYWFLSRHVVTGWAPAFIGGMLCGFGPGMASQGNGHPNLVAQFLVPIIIWRVLKLREGRFVRDGIILGLLITWQAFINEEVLLLVAVGLGLFVLAMAIMSEPEVRQAWRRPLLAGLGVAAGVSVLLLAYPLWFQFFGTGAYRGLPRGIELFGTDAGAFPTFNRMALLGDPWQAARLAPNASEENTFFGWPLFVGVLVIIAWLWRERLVRALAIVGLVLSAMALGPKVNAYSHNTSIPGPWRLLSKLPLLDTVVPVRIGLFVLPVVGVIIALGIQRIHDTFKTTNPTALRFAYLGMGLALIPLIPVPLPVVERRVPEFIASGAWKEHVPEGRSLVTLPLPSTMETSAMRWSASTNLAFPIASGYFLGPGGPDGTSLFGPPGRPTAELFSQVMRSKRPAVIGDRERAAAREDLEFWRAGAVVMVPKDNREQEEAMLATATELFGPPEKVGGLWVWDVTTEE